MTNVILPSSDADKQRIKGCVEEIANAMTMIQAQKDFIKEAVASCAEEVEVDKKYLRKLASIHYKHNLSEVLTEVEDVEALYESVMV